MTPTQAATLLAVAAAFDNRKPDADAAMAWSIALDGFRYEDCRDAIVAHYRNGNEWLMPSHVIAGVRRLREKRVDHYGPMEPPADLDPDDTGAYAHWFAETRRAIADGTLTEPPPPSALPRRDVIAELGHIGQPVPDA